MDIKQFYEYMSGMEKTKDSRILKESRISSSPTPTP